MIPFFKRIFSLFFTNEAFFERGTRAVLMGLAGSGVAFGNDIASIAGLPSWGKGIKIAGVVAGFLSVMISAGGSSAATAPPPTPPAT